MDFFTEEKRNGRLVLVVVLILLLEINLVLTSCVAFPSYFPFSGFSCTVIIFLNVYYLFFLVGEERGDINRYVEKGKKVLVLGEMCFLCGV